MILRISWQIGRLTVEKDKKINMVRKQYSVNTSVDNEEDLDSTFSSSIPTPVNTKEQEGGFMAPITVENEEDKPFFTRKRSLLSSSMESDNNDEVDSMLPTPPDYESMSLEQLKVSLGLGAKLLKLVVVLVCSIRPNYR